VIPIVERVVKWLLALTDSLAGAGPASFNLREALTLLIPEDLLAKIMGFIDMIDRLVGEMRAFYTRHKDAFIATFEVIADNVEAALKATAKIVRKALDKIGKFWDEHGEAIMAVVGTLAKGVITTIEIALVTLSGLVTLILQAVAGDWEGFVATWLRTGERLLGLWSRIWENMRSVVIRVWNGIVSFIYSKIDALMSILEPLISISDWLGGALGGIAELGTAVFEAPTPLPSLAMPIPVTSPEVTNYNLYITTSAPSEPIIADFGMMRALGGLIP